MNYRADALPDIWPMYYPLDMSCTETKLKHTLRTNQVYAKSRYTTDTLPIQYPIHYRFSVRYPTVLLSAFGFPPLCEHPSFFPALIRTQFIGYYRFSVRYTTVYLPETLPF